jgi:hypothetical protein
MHGLIFIHAMTPRGGGILPKSADFRPLQCPNAGRIAGDFEALEIPPGALVRTVKRRERRAPSEVAGLREGFFR